MQVTIAGTSFLLLPQRAIYSAQHSALILADLHIGKSMHFRKGGIAIPGKVFDEDLLTLNTLIQQHQPQQLIIVGDMFHSHDNVEITLFDLWRAQYPQLTINLVKGNHDILPEEKYSQMGITTHSALSIDNFLFSHEPPATYNQYCFSGHIHPGVRVEGAGRQSLRLPCFHIGGNHCTLPAFSRFTGLHTIKPVTGDRIFAVIENEIVPIQAD